MRDLWDALVERLTVEVMMPAWVYGLIFWLGFGVAFLIWGL